MKVVTPIVIVASCCCVHQATARCANDCNGKGDCNALNQCDCFPNFRGPDCSFRLCPAGKAFIDTPLGDIDGDGDVGVDLVYRKGISTQPVSELLHVDYASARPGFMNTQSWDEAHFYAECSNKGDCDPITGVCNCYPGYDGSACNRNACPDDCSGHGTCKTYEGSAYAGWDVEATTYCDCDARWTGPSCSLRVCRTNVDPVETSIVDTSRMQRIAFRSFGPLNWITETNFDLYPFGDFNFAITATDEYGDEWTTELMTVKYDAWYATSTDRPDTYFIPRLLTSEETIGKQSRRHVSQTVEDALNALPHNPLGEVSVSEIYTMVSIINADDEFEAFEFYHQNYTDLSCELTDIYDQTGGSNRPIVGCGTPAASQYLGINSGNDRNGGLDINQYIADDQPYIMLVGTGTRYDALNYDSPIVVPADSADVTPLNGQDHRHVGASGGAGNIFSFGYAYYMYPHYNNDDDADVRFPLFADPDLTSSDFYSEEYSSIFLFDWDANVADLDSSSTSYLAGLSLYIKYDATPVQTLFRVDYFYANEHVLLFENFKDTVSSAWKDLLVQPGYDNVVGSTYEGCTESVCVNDIEIVSVDDVGSQRVWDVLYHGTQNYFLGDGNPGADAEVHECAKRGMCDFETGLCSCYSGYSGLDCSEVNALAYGL